MSNIDDSIEDPASTGDQRLGKILQSRDGYLIRPYVNLKGQTNGYQWRPGTTGKWTMFVDNLQQKYTIANTGKK